jgi:hypothetical protein
MTQNIIINQRATQRLDKTVSANNDIKSPNYYLLISIFVISGSISVADAMISSYFTKNAIQHPPKHLAFLSKLQPVSGICVWTTFAAALLLCMFLYSISVYYLMDKDMPALVKEWKKNNKKERALALIRLIVAVCAAFANAALAFTAMADRWVCHHILWCWLFLGLLPT